MQERIARSSLELGNTDAFIQGFSRSTPFILHDNLRSLRIHDRCVILFMEHFEVRSVCFSHGKCAVTDHRTALYVCCLLWRHRVTVYMHS